MNIKAIALDLDGTLLTTDKKISDVNKKILRQLEEKGIKIFIVTGRSYMSAKPFAQELGMDSYIISYNGAKVVDYKKDEIIFELPLAEKYVKTLIELSKKRGFHVNLYQNNIWYVEDKDSEETKKYGASAGLIPEIKPFDTFDSYAMTKVTVQDNLNSPEFNQYFSEVVELFGDEVYTAKSQDYLFEILNKDVNKGVILKRVLEMYGIDPSECVAFGDAQNDIEMLTMVGYGVAMGNSPDFVKDKVKYTTDTNDNDGVAKFLETLF